MMNYLLVEFLAVVISMSFILLACLMASSNNPAL